MSSTKVRSRQTRGEVVVLGEFGKSVLTCRFDGRARPTVGEWNEGKRGAKWVECWIINGVK